MASNIENNIIRSAFLSSQSNLINVIAAIQSEIDRMEENEKTPEFLISRKKNQVEAIIDFNNAVEDLLFLKSTDIEICKVELTIAKKALQAALDKETELINSLKKNTSKEE